VIHIPARQLQYQALSHGRIAWRTIGETSDAFTCRKIGGYCWKTVCAELSGKQKPLNPDLMRVAGVLAR